MIIKILITIAVIVFVLIILSLLIGGKAFTVKQLGRVWSWLGRWLRKNGDKKGPPALGSN